MNPQQLGPYQAADVVNFEIDATNPDGTPSDLTSLTPHFHLFRPETPEDLVASTDATPSTITASKNTPATDGVVKVSITGAVTADLWGTYEWRCNVVAIADQQLIARGYVDFTTRAGP